MSDKLNRRQKIKILNNVRQVVAARLVSKKDFPWESTWIKPRKFFGTVLPRSIVALIGDPNLYDYDQIQIILSLLSKTRELNDHVCVKITTITDPFKGDEPLFRKFMEKIDMKWIKVRLPFIEYEKKDTILDEYKTTSGPNGRPSWLSSFLDSIALNDDKVLFKSISCLNELLLSPKGVKSFNDRFNSTFDLATTLFQTTKKPLICSKLSGIADYYGKTRVIAIADYYSQMSLKPISDHIFKILRRLKSDGTFGTYKIRQKMIMLQQANKKIWSFDLSAATDRFPAVFTKLVIEKIFNKDISDSWFEVICRNRSFSCRTRKRKKTVVKYSVGQPMGVNSSWASFTLSHHCLLRILEYELGLLIGDNYGILGDDIVIFNEQLADRYEKMIHVFGVELSKPKSIIPTIDRPIQAELAKRVLIDGIDVSPFPLRLLKIKNKRVSYSLFLCEVLERRTRWNPVSFFLLLRFLEYEVVLTAVLHFSDFESTNKFLESEYGEWIKDVGVSESELNFPGFDGQRCLVPGVRLTAKNLWNCLISHIGSIRECRNISINLKEMVMILKTLKRTQPLKLRLISTILDDPLIYLKFGLTSPFMCLYNQTVGNNNVLSVADASDGEIWKYISGLDDLRTLKKALKTSIPFNKLIKSDRVDKEIRMPILVSGIIKEVGILPKSEMISLLIHKVNSHHQESSLHYLKISDDECRENDLI
jgi:hypothetical protein